MNWIKIEDRLPEACQEVLVFWDGFVIIADYWIDYSDEDKIHWHYHEGSCHPTHWMPLPEAPED